MGLNLMRFVRVTSGRRSVFRLCLPLTRGLFLPSGRQIRVPGGVVLIRRVVLVILLVLNSLIVTRWRTRRWGPPVWVVPVIGLLLGFIIVSGDRTIVVMVVVLIVTRSLVIKFMWLMVIVSLLILLFSSLIAPTRGLSVTSPFLTLVLIILRGVIMVFRNPLECFRTIWL